MTTTKKVGKGGSSALKKTPKKVVSSNVKKTPTKKSAKKVVKKVVAKSKVKKATAKKITATKAKKSKKISNKQKMAASLGASAQIALISSYTLPLKTDLLAIQTARFSGVFFVAAGAFFTLMFSQHVWSEPLVAQIASTASVTSGTVSECDPEIMSSHDYNKCLFEEQTPQNGTDAAGAPNKKPPATFVFEDIQLLQGVVPVEIFIEDAYEVDVLVFRESYTNPIVLGSATEAGSGSSRWVFQWDTEKHPDGNYKLAVDVFNAYNVDSPYRNAHSNYREVRNTPDSTSSTTASEIVSVDTQPDAVLSLRESSPVAGDVQLTVAVADALEVKLYAYHVDSGSKNYIGRAYEATSGNWRYNWDTVPFVNGEYQVEARVKNESGNYETNTVSFAVMNLASGTTENAPKEPVDTSLVDEPSPTSQESVDQTIASAIPDIFVSIPNQLDLSGTIDITVETATAQFVELYVVAEATKKGELLGLASKADVDIWTYRWYTKNQPNGKYALFARVKNKYGAYGSDHELVRVDNSVVSYVATKEQEVIKTELLETKKAEDALREEQGDLFLEKQDTIIAEDGTESLDPDESQSHVLISQYRVEIEAELTRLSSALRSQDVDQIQRAKARLENLKQEIIATIADEERKADLTIEINTKIDALVEKHTELDRKIEKIIVERSGDKIFLDTDKDGITDYDEISLYNTDPFSADSDSDGVIDGLEIEGGYDPLDATREVAVVYESPRESGVERKDLLAVETITAVHEDEPGVQADGVPAQAVIAGRALPNSFVTLYIFSTPVIVTVRTESDGSWQYRFDKELEDGEHNVYVGVTDNAGRIVAKSEPFAFVKEAQAFSPSDAVLVSSTQTQPDENSLLSEYMIYLILSISVVSIGLVLILLGIHVDSRQRRLVGVTLPEEEKS